MFITYSFYFSFFFSHCHFFFHPFDVYFLLFCEWTIIHRLDFSVIFKVFGIFLWHLWFCLKLEGCIVTIVRVFAKKLLLCWFGFSPQNKHDSKTKVATCINFYLGTLAVVTTGNDRKMYYVGSLWYRFIFLKKISTSPSNSCQCLDVHVIASFALIPGFLVSNAGLIWAMNLKNGVNGRFGLSRPSLSSADFLV